MAPQNASAAADDLLRPTANRLLGAPIDLSAPAAPPTVAVPAAAPDRPAGRWAPHDVTVPREYFTGTVLLLQLALLAAAFTLLPAEHRVLATTAGTAVVLLLAAVRLGGHRLTGWALLWGAWKRRQRAVRRATRRGERVNPLWLVTRRPRVGSVRGPLGSEIGVLREQSGWNSALWVTDAPSAGEQVGDGLTEVLALAAPRSPAVEMRAVVQQSSPEADDPDPALMVTAWLVLHVDPLPELAPRAAIGAVPALLRSEIRRLIQATSDGGIRLVTLDRSDLLGALASSTETPPTAGERLQPVKESWNEWEAGGRHHRSFSVRPTGGAGDLADAVDLALEAAGLAPATTVTVSVRYGEPRGRGRRDPVTVRVSHASPMVLVQIVARLQDALRASGCRLRPLGGVQGPAVLETSVMAGRMPG